jgi:hypothetical protein
MKVRRYLDQSRDRDVLRQIGIHRSFQTGQIVPPRGVKGNDLPLGVNTGVRAARGQHGRLCLGYPLQRRFELSLNRRSVELPLKALIICAVVGHKGLYTHRIG